MDLFRETKTEAKEYFLWALTIYKGCIHHCDYCYVPGATFTSKQKYYEAANPKKDFIERLKKDIVRFKKNQISQTKL